MKTKVIKKEQQIDKCVLIDKEGEYMFIGFSEKELKEAIESPEAFSLWLKMFGKEII